MRFFIVFLLLLAGPNLALARSWSFDVLGFGITTPEGWSEADAEQHFKNLSMIDHGALQEHIARATAPMVAVMRYPEPHPDLNPSLKVNVRPVPPGDFTLVQLLTAVTGQLKNAFPDVEFIEPPQVAEVGGVEAAYAKMHYTLIVKDVGEFPTESQMWIVIHNDLLFIFGVGTPQEAAPDIVAELEAAMASVRFTDR